VLQVLKAMVAAALLAVASLQMRTPVVVASHRKMLQLPF
jgi:hypothetical protein